MTVYHVTQPSLNRVKLVALNLQISLRLLKTTRKLKLLMYVHKSTLMCKLLQEDLQNSFSVDDTKQQPIAAALVWLQRVMIGS